MIVIMSDRCRRMTRGKKRKTEQRGRGRSKRKELSKRGEKVQK